MLHRFSQKSSHTPSKTVESRPRRQRRQWPGLEALEGRQLLSMGVQLEGNVFLTGSQQLPSTASAPNGKSVVAWVDGTSSSNRGIDFRLFNASGSPTTADLPVPGSGGAVADHPAVAMDSQGNFVVVWSEPVTFAGNNILAQRFHADGSPSGSNIFVATTANDESSPDVAMDGAGNFVIVYEQTDTANPATGRDVLAKRYSSGGAFQGVVDTQSGPNVPGYRDLRPSVAMAADGRYAIAYEYAVNGSSNTEIWMLTYAANTGAPNRAFHVSNTAAAESDPDIAMNDFGDVVVVYERLIGSTSSDHDLKAKRVPFNGPLSSEIHVTGSVDDDHDPKVAMNRTGRSFVVAYDVLRNDGVRGVGVVEFSANNTRTGLPILGNVANPSISIGANGQYQVVYQNTATDKNVFRRRGSFFAN